MSLINKLLKLSEYSPKKTAILDKELSITYEQLVIDIKSTAHKLNQNKVKQGDSVIVVANNSYAFICIYYAVHYVGATVVSLATDVDNNYKNSVIKKIKPALLIDNCSAFIKDLEQYDGILSNNANNDHIADIVYTSGTTGEPKGVPLTHSQLVLATEHIIAQVKNTSEDVELLLMPLSHSFGMGRMRTTLYAGGTLVIGYSLQRLKSVFKSIEKHNVTGLGLVPSAWNYIREMSKNLITKYSSQLKYIEFGSAYLAPEEKATLTDWFPNTNLVMHYGLTEVSRAIFTNFHTDNHHAVGKIGFGANIAIATDNGALNPNAGEGEIVFKANWMLSKYFENNQLTSDSFIEGYFRTGDLGKIEGDYLFLTGRLKEIINVGGKKVSPYQVEDVLNTSKLVSESVCTALADKDNGEVVQAFIVLKAEVVVEHSEIIEQLKNIISNALPIHMRPKKYQFITSIPKTALGKIQRLKLASQ